MGCNIRKTVYSYENVFFFFFQENLLFDEYHKLKLIYFGLCAKPKVSAEIKMSLFPLPVHLLPVILH